MPRITETECSYLDVEWYGVDQRGQIAVFCSGGAGDLPEFVCEDAERTDQLAEYFGGISAVSECRLLHEKGEQARQVAQEFSEKGLFYFDADDQSDPRMANLQPFYTKVSVPLRPLAFDELPEQVKALLRYNLLEVNDFSQVDVITVKHAYGTSE